MLSFYLDMIIIDALRLLLSAPSALCLLDMKFLKIAQL
jgi:hypothetical protein